MSDSSEDRERFDVDNDYEGGQWIGGEFFYEKKRKKRQQTEEDRIYGVFAEGDSDDEYERRPSKRERADYAKPVNFVSKGTVQDEKADEAKEQRPRVSVAAAPSEGGRGGLGFGGAGLGARPQKQDDEVDEDDEVDDEQAVLPTAFGRRYARGGTRLL